MKIFLRELFWHNLNCFAMWFSCCASKDIHRIPYVGCEDYMPQNTSVAGHARNLVWYLINQRLKWTGNNLLHLLFDSRWVNRLGTLISGMLKHSSVRKATTFANRTKLSMLRDSFQNMDGSLHLVKSSQQLKKGSWESQLHIGIMRSTNVCVCLLMLMDQLSNCIRHDIAKHHSTIFSSRFKTPCIHWLGPSFQGQTALWRS